MAESIRLRYDVGSLPNDLVNIVGDREDVRVFLGAIEGEPVLLRVQKLCRARSAFIIIQKGDHTRTMWHEHLDRCTIYLPQSNWYLCLESTSDKPPIEVRIDDMDPYVLEEWLKG